MARRKRSINFGDPRGHDNNEEDASLPSLSSNSLYWPLFHRPSGWWSLLDGVTKIELWPLQYKDSLKNLTSSIRLFVLFLLDQLQPYLSIWRQQDSLLPSSMMALAISFSVPFASSDASLEVSVEEIAVTASPVIAMAKKGPFWDPLVVGVVVVIVLFPSSSFNSRGRSSSSQ